MRRAHFEALRPVCPVCRIEAPLAISSAIREHGDDLLEGVLTCSNAGCLREYPVVDGIPVIVTAIRAWLAANPLQMLLRDDLSAEVEGLLGDVLGAGSPFDTLRNQTGLYADDHYEGGGALQTLDAALDRVRDLEAPALDLGCATGGTTFRLAQRTGGLAIGVDLNFAMLRIASRALREGRVRYARRKVGVVYERRELDVQPDERVDFWCCDAAALPFASGTFPLAAAINILDCVGAPRETLAELARVLRPGAAALIATPYDWSPTATPIESWLGGHSQRGAHGGASEPVLRMLLGELGLEIVYEEPSLPWRLRLNERSTVEYRVHLVVARRAGSALS